MNSTKLKFPKKALFLGLGGAGQRHLRCIKKVFQDTSCYTYRFKNKSPLLNPDFTVDNLSTVNEKYSLNLLDDYETHQHS